MDVPYIINKGLLILFIFVPPGFENVVPYFVMLKCHIGPVCRTRADEQELKSLFIFHSYIDGLETAGSLPPIYQPVSCTSRLMVIPPIFPNSVQGARLKYSTAVIFYSAR